MDDLNTISLIAWLALFATLGTVLMVWWATSAMAALSAPRRTARLTAAKSIPSRARKANVGL
jgi:hypothetical protein